MKARRVDGELLAQPVEVIVNGWNRNLFPWWLLWPQGVSGAIKRRAGTGPFRELSHLGLLPLGHAVLTSAGRLPFRGIIHVVSINLAWRASERSIGDSVRSAMALVARHGFRSVAFPALGAGAGGFDEARSLQLMEDTLAPLEGPAEVTLVRFRP